MLSGIVTNVISIECVPIDLILSSNVRNHAAKYAYLIDSSSMPWVSSHRTDRTRDDEAYCAAHLPRVVSLSSWKVFVVNVWETRVKKKHIIYRTQYGSVGIVGCICRPFSPAATRRDNGGVALMHTWAFLFRKGRTEDDISPCHVTGIQIRYSNRDDNLLS